MASDLKSTSRNKSFWYSILPSFMCDLFGIYPEDIYYDFSPKTVDSIVTDKKIYTPEEIEEFKKEKKDLEKQAIKVKPKEVKKPTVSSQLFCMTDGNLDPERIKLESITEVATKHFKTKKYQDKFLVECKKLFQKLEKIESRIDQHTTSKDNIEKEISKTKTNIQEKQKKIDSIDQELDNIETIIKDLNQKTQELQNKITTNQDKRDELKEKNAKILKEHNVRGIRFDDSKLNTQINRLNLHKLKIGDEYSTEQQGFFDKYFDRNAETGELTLKKGALPSWKERLEAIGDFHNNRLEMQKLDKSIHADNSSLSAVIQQESEIESKAMNLEDEILDIRFLIEEDKLTQSRLETLSLGCDVEIDKLKAQRESLFNGMDATMDKFCQKDSKDHTSDLKHKLSKGLITIDSLSETVSDEREPTEEAIVVDEIEIDKRLELEKDDPNKEEVLTESLSGFDLEEIVKEDKKRLLEESDLGKSLGVGSDDLSKIQSITEDLIDIDFSSDIDLSVQKPEITEAKVELKDGKIHQR